MTGQIRTLDRNSAKPQKGCAKAARNWWFTSFALPEGPEQHPAKAIDIVMLTVAGGRERTAKEYAALFCRCGLWSDGGRGSDARSDGTACGFTRQASRNRQTRQASSLDAVPEAAPSDQQSPSPDNFSPGRQNMVFHGAGQFVTIGDVGFGWDRRVQGKKNLKMIGMLGGRVAVRGAHIGLRACANTSVRNWNRLDCLSRTFRLQSGHTGRYVIQGPMQDPAPHARLHPYPA